VGIIFYDFPLASCLLPPASCLLPFAFVTAACNCFIIAFLSFGCQTIGTGVYILKKNLVRIAKQNPLKSVCDRAFR